MADVDADEYGGETFDDAGVGQRPGVERGQAGQACQFDGNLFGLFAIACHQDIAVQGVVGVAQVLSRDVLERGYHLDAIAQERLRFLAG